MYGKYFASTFTGSLMGAGANVFAVWGYVIANTTGGQVELNPRLLAAVLGMSVAEVAKAIDYLAAPDPESRSKIEEGRRLIREGEFCYRVPNFATYRAIRNEDDRREYNRQKQAEHRSRVKARVIDSQSLSSVSAHAETETETETEAETENPPTPQRGKRTRRKAVEPPPLPASLDSPPFRAAWDDWIRHRREIKKPLTQTQTAKQLALMARMGVDRSIAAIEHTVSMGWQGLKEPDHSAGNNGHTPAAYVPRPINIAAIEAGCAIPQE